jgi:pimeloyl-ACP methyl ester carboxylesterase
VAARLRSSGHDVRVPSLLGVGDLTVEHPERIDVSTHVRQITAEFDRFESTDVVLVGFSYGGYVITAVADNVSHRISRLIYLDAFVPQAGRCFLDVVPSPVRAMMEASAAQAGHGWHVPPAPVQMVGGIGAMEPDVSAEHVNSVLTRRGPHPIATYRQVMPAPSRHWADIPRLFVSCTDKPAGDPLVTQANALRAAGWTVQEIPTGHFAMLSMPDAVAAVLDDNATDPPSGTPDTATGSTSG